MKKYFRIIIIGMLPISWVGDSSASNDDGKYTFDPSPDNCLKSFSSGGEE
jgi:hypothetical protein